MQASPLGNCLKLGLPTFWSRLRKCMQSTPSRECSPTSDSSSQMTDTRSRHPAFCYLFILRVVPNESKAPSWNTACCSHEEERPFHTAFQRADDELMTNLLWLWVFIYFRPVTHSSFFSRCCFPEAFILVSWVSKITATLTFFIFFLCKVLRWELHPRDLLEASQHPCDMGSGFWGMPCRKAKLKVRETNAPFWGHTERKNRITG